MKSILLTLCCLLLSGRAAASDLSIVVLKAERRLEVFRGPEKIHTFRIGLGGAPVGDKERSGDKKTPEGRFYVCVKNPQSQFYLSLGISYPDTAAAQRGLREGLITRPQHDAIVAAQQQKTTPPWDTALGGEIFIHGHGSAKDWTLGCMALDNPEMKTLFDLIEVGTVVEIRP
ncbi:MAG: L,D-transpeptidase family protein [Verrucomicrobia bacterium]|nr:L,D-transpeptidase family protein [Verrucomicrobiota bacterium]